MMRLRVVVLTVAALVLALAGCTSEEPVFPAGAWALVGPTGVVVVDFRADGSLAGGQGETGQDPAAIALEPNGGSARWSATAEDLTLTGPWCGSEVSTAVYR